MKFKFLIIQLFVVMFFFSVLAEFYFRGREDTKNKECVALYCSDDYLNHILKPNFKIAVKAHREIPTFDISTNAIGLRVDSNKQNTNDKAEKNILVCGDSFVLGYEWSKTIPARLQNSFNAQSEIKYNFINAGVGSYSPTLHYFFLKKYLPILKPDLVLLFIDMTDHYDDSIRYKQYLNRNEAGEIIGVYGSINKNIELTAKNVMSKASFYSYDYIISALSKYSAISRYLFVRSINRLVKTYSTDEQDVYKFKKNYNTEAIVAINYSLEWVVKIHELLEQYSVKLVIGLYPHREVLEDPNLEQFFEHYKKLAKDRNIPLHLALDDFKQAIKTHSLNDLFLTDDMHYAYLGQEIWANSIYKFLNPKLPELLAD